MSVLIDKNTRVIVQGITGRDGSFHTKKMKEYGTNVVAGISPGKGGQSIDGIPVFNSMHEATKALPANTSVIFVPAPFAADAICEAADAEIKLIVAITEGIPVIDIMKVIPYLQRRNARLIGPNCPGIISPGKSKVGILPANIFKPGKIGVISRSGTLTYEVVDHITKSGLGESTCIGIGGDPVVGMDFIDCLKLFEEDPETESVVLIGEIGGNAEELAAKFAKDEMSKPVVGFIVGKTAPPGKRMGHAGAIISGGSGTASEKISALEDAGIPVANQPSEVPILLKKRL